MLSVPLVAALPRTNVHHWWQQVCLRRIRNIHNPFFPPLSGSLLPCIFVVCRNSPQWSVLPVITTTSRSWTEPKWMGNIRRNAKMMMMASQRCQELARQDCQWVGKDRHSSAAALCWNELLLSGVYSRGEHAWTARKRLAPFRICTPNDLGKELIL